MCVCLMRGLYLTSDCHMCCLMSSSASVSSSSSIVTLSALTHCGITSTPPLSLSASRDINSRSKLYKYARGIVFDFLGILLKDLTYLILMSYNLHNCTISQNIHPS